ncbi:MAG TPA: FtsX-like permease family protein [Streptosporangiaceae bacterium]
MRASLRWIRADLRARPGQALAALLVVAGVVIALLLSAALLQGATNPWQGLFTASRGAQIWLRLGPGTDVAALRSRVGGISGVAGPYPSVAATVARGRSREPAELRAMGTRLPAIGRPLLTRGRWLTRARPGGVVLESSFAQALHVADGSTLTLDNLDGLAAARVRVVGIAVTSDQGFYPDQTPGLMWVLPGVLQQVARHGGDSYDVAGLQLANPAATTVVTQQVVAQLGSGAVRDVSTWQQVKQSMARRDPLLGLVLALFGLVALGAAMLAVINATSGRVLVQRADLGMLQTLGFTPRQVMTMLVAQHAALGAAGVAVGLAAARLLAPWLLGAVPGVSAGAATLPVGWSLLIVGGIEVAVILATAVPGWRAGRVWPVAAVRPAPPHGHLSALARAAMASRLPPAIVLGARAAFTRRLPALLTIGGLAVPMAMITIGLGFWATLDEVQSHPGDIGLAAGLTVSPGTMSSARAWQLVNRDPAVAAAYRGVQVTALLPGETTTVTTLGMGTSARPFPFRVVQGQLYHAPEEAVATQGLLDALGAHVGELVQMPFGGVPVTFRIVGRIIDPQYDGQVLAYGRDMLADEGAATPPVFYSLVLRRGASAAAAQSWLERRSGGRLQVAAVVSPASQLGIVRVMIAGAIVVLALIGLTSLVTASFVGLRDHLREIRVLCAMGLTPVQVLAALMARSSMLALVAAGIGVSLGLAACTGLINLAARLYGLGAGIGALPSGMTLAIAVTLAVVIAALTAAIPARHYARAPSAAVLGAA